MQATAADDSSVIKLASFPRPRPSRSEGFGEDDPHVASACNNLAEFYRLRRQFDLAEPLYQQVGGPCSAWPRGAQQALVWVCRVCPRRRRARPGTSPASSMPGTCCSLHAAPW